MEMTMDSTSTTTGTSGSSDAQLQQLQASEQQALSTETEIAGMQQQFSAEFAAVQAALNDVNKVTAQ
jgi:hypothetical protein